MFNSNLMSGDIAIEPAPKPRADVAPRETSAMRIAFIGLDGTGQAMASRLHAAGHVLTAYDPKREVEPLASARWSVASSIGDACRSADAVFTMLTEQLARAVILGKGGVIECLPRDAIHVGSSIISVECADVIVEAHWDAGRQYVAAPVLVRPDSTLREKRLVIAGGAEATIVQVAPALRAIGQVARVSGWPSDANLVRLGADCEGAALFQFLARHPEFCRRQLGRSWRTNPNPFAQFLDLETRGGPL